MDHPSFEEDFDEEPSEDFEDSPLADAIDIEILKHRDAHFGGKFDIMLDYYARGGKGISEDFEISRIEQLALIEKGLGKNLAGLTLSAADAEIVSRARLAYSRLRDMCENASSKNPNLGLIAELILSEEDEEAAAMQAIVAKGKAMVPDLLELVRNPEFYDSLMPGYGRAPILALQCLGEIGDERGIISLFEFLGHSNFFDEDVAIDALKKIGEPAKRFLLRVLKGKPYSDDNERAAIALIHFKDDPQVAEECFALLKQLDIKKHWTFATYLVFVCEGLKNAQERKEFALMGQSEAIPRDVRRDMAQIASAWK